MAISTGDIGVTIQSWTQTDLAQAGEIPDVQDSYTDREIWARRLSDAAETLQTIDGVTSISPLSQNSYLVRWEPDYEIKAGDRLVDDGVVYHISEVLILNRNRFLQLLCKELIIHMIWPFNRKNTADDNPDLETRSYSSIIEAGIESEASGTCSFFRRNHCRVNRGWFLLKKFDGSHRFAAFNERHNYAGIAFNNRNLDCPGWQRAF